MGFAYGGWGVDRWERQIVPVQQSTCLFLKSPSGNKFTTHFGLQAATSRSWHDTKGAFVMARNPQHAKEVERAKKGSQNSFRVSPGPDRPPTPTILFPGWDESGEETSKSVFIS